MNYNIILRAYDKHYNFAGTTERNLARKNSIKYFQKMKERVNPSNPYLIQPRC